MNILAEFTDSRRSKRRERPLHTHREQDSFNALLAALKAGWHIETPVYLRPSWGSQCARNSQLYHFFLQRGASVTLLSVEDSPRLHVFLDEHAIQVNQK